MECEKCSRKFENEEKYNNHQQQKCRRHVCPHCDNVFKKVQHLNQHLNKQKKLTCDHCDGKFCDYAHFQRHLRSIRKETDDTK